MNPSVALMFICLTLKTGTRLLEKQEWELCPLKYNGALIFSLLLESECTQNVIWVSERMQILPEFFRKYI